MKTSILFCRITPDEKAKLEEIAHKDDFETLSQWLRHLLRKIIKKGGVK